jgi:hypothetical protein
MSLPSRVGHSWRYQINNLHYFKLRPRFEKGYVFSREVVAQIVAHFIAFAVGLLFAGRRPIHSDGQRYSVAG